MRAALALAFFAASPAVGQSLRSVAPPSSLAEVKLHRLSGEANAVRLLIEVSNRSGRFSPFIDASCTAFDATGAPLGVETGLTRNLGPGESDRRIILIRPVAPAKASAAASASCRIVSVD
jgi:hypothetical protein